MLARALIWLALLFPTVASSQSYTGDISNATGKIPDSGALTRTFANRAAEHISALDFCSAAVANNTSWSTSLPADTCLQAAINALCARSNGGGGVLFVPPGTYYVAGTVTIGCQGMEIAGGGASDRGTAPSGVGVAPGTRILAGARADQNPVFLARVTSYAGPNDAGETGSLPSPSRFSHGFYLHDMSFLQGGSGTVRPGPFLEMDYWQEANISRVYMFAACNGIAIKGGFKVGIEDTTIDSYASNCPLITISGDATKSYTPMDIAYFNRVTVNAYGEGSTCWKITDRVQTVWWQNVTCETYGSAILSSCPTMSNVLYCPGFYTLNDFESESFGSGTYRTISLVDTVDGFKMTNSWMRGAAGSGSANLIYMGRDRFKCINNADGSVNNGCGSGTRPMGALTFEISNSWLKYSGGSLIYIDSGNFEAAITGNHIYGADKYGIGAFGIEIYNDGGTTITGNIFCGDDWLRGITWPMKGIGVGAAGDYVTVTGNVFRGNQNGQVNGCSGTAFSSSSGGHFTSSGNVGP